MFVENKGCGETEKTKDTGGDGWMGQVLREFEHLTNIPGLKVLGVDRLILHLVPGPCSVVHRQICSRGFVVHVEDFSPLFLFVL